MSVSPQRTKRILITGSRDWNDRLVIEEALSVVSEPGAVLISGACPTGADRLSENVWDYWHLPIERHPADWQKFGKRAGFIRNQEMVDSGADICFAFIRNDSKGATHTANAARKAGIPVKEFRIND